MPETESLLEAAYAKAAPPLLAALVEFLATAQRASGDLERLLILLAILQRAYSAPGFAEFALSRGADSDRWDPLTTNVLSLAETVSIPKETVRRKVNALIENGFIERVDQRLRITPAGLDHLCELRSAFIRLTARQHDITAHIRSDEHHARAA